MNSASLPLCGENMRTSKCDRKGRLLLRPALRRRFGDEFFVVEAPRKINLLPVPRDPVKDLRELGRALKGYSIAELKETIRQQAMEEAGG
jgi:hypothetical protein